MEEEVRNRFAEQDAKLDAIYRSVEKTRKYILWTSVTQIVFFVLPLIGLSIAIPWFLNIFSNAYNGLL